ncbi:Coenzyme F420 hydrogenase/dehydrogenase, beta subunit C-terminal domain [Niallia sp. FSL K6-0212]|uniref:Coenzyme F420 hydrogenase/dehydrogenase, beta subunit C-terminal domain n=1 Tax=Niallia sp. FSL K6-0212 TaxID=2921423 RepID=UPI0030FA1700
MNQNVRELMEKVIDNDYCVGCGICASVKGSPFKMKLDENGKYSPSLLDNIPTEEMDINVLSVCPFAYGKNETEIGKQQFGKEENIKYNEYTGYYLKNYAGYVKEGEFRKKGSSGGMGNWIAKQLLENKLVDGIIHVKSSNDKEEALFDYQVSYSNEELYMGAKSKYYPIEMSKVIQFVKENEGRYALIGIPCFIKSIRLLADKDLVIKERIKYTIGLVCGHLKSDMFAKSMGWQLGVEPDNLTGIDFRKKLDTQYANDYGVEVEGNKDGEYVKSSAPRRELYVGNWGHGLFKYNACEFCDDVLSETADVTVGDAWLPKYTKDSLGTNVIVVRNPIIQKIFEENMDKVHLEEISARMMYESQAGGFRHRRQGLSYRLYLKDKNNQWRPKKRVEASNKMSSKRKVIYEKRTLLSQESFTAYKKALKVNDFNVFIEYMNPIINEYNNIIAPSMLEKSVRKIKRGIFKLIRK